MPGAAVTAVLQSSDDRNTFVYQAAADAEGQRYVVRDVEEGKPFHVCAERTG